MELHNKERILLPVVLKPVHYDLHYKLGDMITDLSFVFVQFYELFMFLTLLLSCEEEIQLQMKQETNHIVLHCIDLTVKNASIRYIEDTKEIELPMSDCKMNEQSETVTITFPAIIPLTATSVKLTATLLGVINEKKMKG